MQLKIHLFFSPQSYRHRPCEDSFRLFGIPGLFRFPFSDGPCDRFGVPSFCPDLLLPVPPLGKGEDRSVTKLNINLDITQPLSEVPKEFLEEGCFIQ